MALLSTSGPARELFAAVGFVIMWSSGFIGARLGTDQSGTLNVLMWRFLIASAALFAWWLIVRRSRISLRDVAIQIVIGLLAQGLYLYGVFSSVEHGVSAGISCLITALQPIAAAVLASLVLSERSSSRQWFGLILGLGGVGLVVAGDMSNAGGASVYAYALSFLAMAGLVAATLIERKLSPNLDLWDAMPIQCAATGTIFTVMALGTGQASVPHSGDFWFAIAWVVVLSTIGGYGFYWFNLKIGNVTRVSSLIYLTPPVTMVWAYMMFDDLIGMYGLAGLVICFVAVAMIRLPSLNIWNLLGSSNGKRSARALEDYRTARHSRK